MKSRNYQQTSIDEIQSVNNSKQEFSGINGSIDHDQNDSIPDKSQLLFDFNQNRQSTDQGKAKDSLRLPRQETNRIQLFTAHNYQTQYQEHQQVSSSVLRQMLKNLDQQSTDYHNLLIKNPPYLYKKKIVKSTSLRNLSMTNRFKSINGEEARRDHLNLKLDQTDANNSTECFDMIRNFNKMAAGRLGQDQASEFKKYLEKSKERAQDRIKTSQYASNYLGSMTDRQPARQPFESLPIPYEKSQKKELVKTFTERHSILQQKITDEEIRLRFAQKASLLKNNNHHKIVNLYDRSLFYKDMKEHVNQEAKRLTDMGYMRRFEEENPPIKDDGFRWLKKKLNYNKKAKDQLKSFQQNLKKAKSHEKLPSINRDQEQFDDYLENFMEIVQNNIKKGPGKPITIPN